MAEMDPFESMRSLAEMWGKSGNAFLQSQQGLFRDMAEKMRAAAEGGAAAQGAAADTAGFEAARQAFGDLWSSATELSAGITKAMQGGAAQGGAAQDPLVAQMLQKIFDPKAWFTGANEFDETLQKMAEGPRLSDLWNVERKFMAVFNAWVALRRRSLEHNRIMLEAWMEAARRFAHVLNERAGKGEKLEGWREMLALWVETANTALLETQRSEAFLQSQREVLKSSTDLRLAQRELAEFYSEMYGYPTRAELDDVHKTVTELRRELRALKRERREAPPAPAPAPAKRASKKRKEATP
ncbi:MAG TPA: poly(R)-hydroxyalkanoic acid synthase subunit PhaE [Beijerinckiaceae bacterium]|jgi:class III poly(R)-hydroxyalkanoic acid synthase PhaE subunit